MILRIILFLFLVVIPAILYLPQLPHHLREFKKGWRGLLILPVSVTILLSTAFLSFWLAQHATFLQWGWLGHNIVFGPSEEPTGGSIPLPLTLLFVGVIIILFNYYEEQPVFRETWKGVGGWASLHLVMGISLYAIIPIFSVGVVYKVVYDRMGQQEAYAVHVMTNMTLIGIVAVIEMGWIG